jgi:hypothetical protein
MRVPGSLACTAAAMERKQLRPVGATKTMRGPPPSLAGFGKDGSVAGWFRFVGIACCSGQFQL